MAKLSRRQARTGFDVGYEVSLKAWRGRLKGVSGACRNTEGSHDRSLTFART